ncbi:hypothetical protein CEXT_443341 [Caerostris extrusa]|uniref:Uncharacterized protein n=1 Tax=Caerostris extrusa TaxID=172846 RepID=A0AAV4RI91_CAEEX|nr:hypothetical protein CEXT_443341 [Caerostris extrusa]
MEETYDSSDPPSFTRATSSTRTQWVIIVWEVNPSLTAMDMCGLLQPTCGAVVPMFARAAHVYGARPWGCDRYWAGVAAQHRSSAAGWLRLVRYKVSEYQLLK